MAKDPAFLFYSNDVMSEVALLNMHQRGIILTLMAIQHQKGHLSEKDVLKISGTYDEDIFRMFETDEEGLFYLPWLEEWILARKKYCESRRNNRASKKEATHEEHMSDHMSPHMSHISSTHVAHMENENEITSSTIGNTTTGSTVSEKKKNTPKKSLSKEELNIPFEEFWDLYDKKVERSACEKKWVRLTDTQRTAAMEHIPKYKAAQPDKSFRKNPETYLNNQSWEDEIIVRGAPKLVVPGTIDTRWSDLYEHWWQDPAFGTVSPGAQGYSWPTPQYFHLVAESSRKEPLPEFIVRRMQNA